MEFKIKDDSENSLKITRKDFEKIKKPFENEDLAYVKFDLSEIQSKITSVCKVKPCKATRFEGVDCLECEDRFGFFKSTHDRRPSSCTWIKKEDTLALSFLIREVMNLVK